MIENVKELKQFMDDGSMLLPEIPVLLRLLQTLGAPEEVDYDYLMSSNFRFRCAAELAAGLGGL